MEAGGTRLVLYPGTRDVFDFWALSDIHYGNRGCYLAGLESDIREMEKDPYALVHLLGDTCDWIAPGDPRWDPSCVAKDVTVNDLADLGTVMLDRILGYLDPIKGKIMAAGLGNHDLKYYTLKQQTLLHDEMCKALDTVNLRYSGFVVYYFQHTHGVRRPQIIKRPQAKDVNRPGQVRLIVYQHHGFGGATTPGGKLNVLKREVDSVCADLVLCGHLHEQISKAFVKLMTDPLGLEIHQHPRMAMMTGSYLRGHVSGCVEYSEVKGYPPTVLGATRARFSPYTRLMSVESRASGVGEVVGG